MTERIIMLFFILTSMANSIKRNDENKPNFDPGSTPDAQQGFKVQHNIGTYRVKLYIPTILKLQCYNL